jgi:hypothetical protein
MNPKQLCSDVLFLVCRTFAGLRFCLLAIIACAAALSPRASAQQQPSLFSSHEIQVAQSPSGARQIALAPGENVVDLDVSPAGLAVAILVRASNDSSRVILWNISTGKSDSIWNVPADMQLHSLAWHPAAQALFLLGTQGTESVILRLDETGVTWKPQIIFHSRRVLRRLVIGPRPFTKDMDSPQPFYRLFFAEQRPDKAYLIATVNERGEAYYQITETATEAASPQARVPAEETQPKQIVAASALPTAFHPAGHLLFWEDGGHCFHEAHYEESNWGKSSSLLGGKVCGGSVTPTPNGIGLLHWQAGKPGIELYLSGETLPTQQAASYTFISTPSSVPDGRGIVGPVRAGELVNVQYVPIDVPLAGVTNAWMFLQSSNDRALLSRNSGLFRPQSKDYDQLYRLYDSEAYACGGYDASVPSRPYFVTTDIFWENFAAAYEGLFILLERREAIPAFWQFVDGANAALTKSGPASAWARAFHALAQVQKGAKADDPEARRILQAAGSATSSVSNHSFDYDDLKPRGHYTASDEEQRYFKAFRYLTSIASDLATPNGESPKELTALPEAVQDHARDWIRTYLSFIAPSRSPEMWSGLPSGAPDYAQHPGKASVIFPLSWGIDNEVLLSTVFHDDWPKAEQISGATGPRTIPSGLDVAAALGNPLARTLLAGEIQKYPPLAHALDDLSSRAQLARKHAVDDLYGRWLDALAVSWADGAAIPGNNSRELANTKQLQTGLASWATLRHATVLVNERTAAECGEGGFEWILLTPPRGYVEPAPKTFEAIASLFDAAADAIRKSPALSSGKLPSEPGEDEKANLALREGVLRRLGESAAKAKVFAAIARKEMAGATLSASDYDEILYVNRTAEYQFLIFKSLANPDFALSNPDPMPKIADVAGGANGIPYLNAAVGDPLEWDQIVPYFGRQEIVKGSVYSYYEFTSPQPMTDAEWRLKRVRTARPSWVTSFLSNSVLSCPAKDPF